MKLNIFFLFFLVFSSLSTTIRAKNPITSAYELFNKKEFHAAEEAFKSGLKHSTNKAEIYKLIGLCQYLQGERTNARANFTKAKELNPRIAIESTYISRYPGVSDFFSKIKVPRKVVTPRSEVRPQPQKQAIQASRKVLITKIIINSNAKNGKVVIDGIVAGDVGKWLTISPGYHQVKVVAKGYQSKKKKIYTQKGQKRDVTINLDVIPTVHKIKKEKKATARVAPPKVIKKKKIRRTHRKHRRKPKRERSEPKIPTEEKTSSTKTKETSPTWQYFMPFGLPQFANNKKLLGTTFAATQAASIGFGIYQIISANNKTDLLNSDFPDQVEVGDSDYENWQTRYDEIKSLQKTGLIMFGVSAGLWLTSSILGHANRPQLNLQTNHHFKKKERDFQESSLDWTWSPSVFDKGNLGLKLSFNF